MTGGRCMYNLIPSTQPSSPPLLAIVHHTPGSSSSQSSTSVLRRCQPSLTWPPAEAMHSLEHAVLSFASTSHRIRPERSLSCPHRQLVSLGRPLSACLQLSSFLPALPLVLILRLSWVTFRPPRGSSTAAGILDSHVVATGRCHSASTRGFHDSMPVMRHPWDGWWASQHWFLRCP